MVYIPPTFGTSTVQPNVNIPERTPRQKCEDKGGFWDEKRQVCLLVPKNKTKLSSGSSSETKSSQPRMIRSGDTGKITGVQLPDGTILPNVGAENAKRLASQNIANNTIPAGSIEQSAFLQQQREANKLQQSASQIGQVGQLTQAVNAPADISQAITAGTIGNAPNIIRNAAAGFAGGALLGGGVTPVAAALGVVGALTAIWSGVNSNIKEQQRGELAAANIVLRNAKTNMRQLAMLASQDPGNADLYISQYNQQLTTLYQARRQTKAEVTGDLNSWMEDGREQLADFDEFLKPGGIADVYGEKLTVALTTGTPLSIIDNELLNQENL